MRYAQVPVIVPQADRSISTVDVSGKLTSGKTRLFCWSRTVTCSTWLLNVCVMVKTPAERSEFVNASAWDEAAE